MRRRTTLWLTPDRGRVAAAEVASVMARKLGWDEPRRRAELQRLPRRAGRRGAIAAARRGRRMRDPLVLAIDQGTTGSTVLLIDRKGRVRGRGYTELPQHFPRPGWVEHDGREIWDSVLTAIARALVNGRARRTQIAAIGITNQRETALLWDRDSGRPVARAIVWQDRRTAARCAALKRRGLEPDVRRRTGLRARSLLLGHQARVAAPQRRRAQGPARRGRLAFGTVDSWLLWKLTAGRVHATDPTNASRTLLYDIGRRRWDERVARACFGVPASLLPRVRPSSGEFGRTHAPARCSRAASRSPGSPAISRRRCSARGCVAAGQSKNTYGTGCFLLLHTGAKRGRLARGLLTTVACGPRGEPAYALEGSVFIAGAALQWLRDGLGDPQARGRQRGDRAPRARLAAAWCWCRRSSVSAPLLAARRARRPVRAHARHQRAASSRAALESLRVPDPRPGRGDGARRRAHA